MMISGTKAANAMGGKTARACDSCLRKRARWFCAADDAFLCQGCDASVHSANQLASRHERVRLQTASSSFKPNELAGLAADDCPSPAWHQGFTRKARTPRHNNNKPVMSTPAAAIKGVLEKLNPLPFVPEMSNDETSREDDDDSEEQLLYRVPIFDPFAAELCNEMGDSRTEITSVAPAARVGNNIDGHLHDLAAENLEDGTASDQLDHLHGFSLPSDTELAEFAADVESLLGREAEEDFCDVKGLVLLGCKEEDVEHDTTGSSVCVNVKEEDEENMEGILGCQVNPACSLDWNIEFEFNSSPGGLMMTAADVQDDDNNKALSAEAAETNTMNNINTNEGSCKEKMMIKKEKFLRLNYEAVITAWDGNSSPWTTGIRPEFNPDDGWPDFMVCNLLFLS